MTRVISLQARMVCNLGVMLSGGTSRDHVIDTWLLRHQGDIEIAGVISPPRGTRVELAYQWHGGLTRFPVRHYVLGASTTPYGRTTTVKIGCRLTLLGNRKPMAPFRAAEHPPAWYQALSGERKLEATPPVASQGLLEWCAEGLGMVIAPGSHVLQGNSLRSEVSGDTYTAILQDLLHSHECIGFPDPADRLVVRKVSMNPGPGPIYDRRFLVEVSPIGNNEGVGESVTVRYTATMVPQTMGNPAPAGVTPSSDVVAVSVGAPRLLPEGSAF